MEVTVRERPWTFSSRVMRFHRGQEVNTSGSRVHPVSWDTDPLTGVVCSQQPSALPSAWARWADVLDAAYGYTLRPDHPRGRARRAPSAGALYPTEVFAIGAFGAYYYDFWGRRFHHAFTIDVDAIVRMFGLGSEDLVLVTAAVFWRTIQRYGIRGYRYCLLDTAHVVRNLLAVIGSRGGVAGVAVAGPSWQLTHALGLPSSVGVVRALVVRSAVQLGGDGKLVPPWSSPPRTAAPEPAPLLSPLLDRVARFHAETLEDARPATPVPLGLERRLAPDRSSARSFAPVPLSEATLSAIRERLATRAPMLPNVATDLRSFIVRIRVGGCSPGVERCDGIQGFDVARWSNANALAARLQSICQDQIVVGKAAVAVVTGIEGSALHGAGPARYHELLSEVGHVGADLAEQAAALELGSTTIGGFSDDEACRLTEDDGWFPVAIQVYGQADTRGHKLDAASRVLENGTHEEKS